MRVERSRRAQGLGFDQPHMRLMPYQKSLDGWANDLSVYRLSYELGGAQKITAPFEENWVVYACEWVRMRNAVAAPLVFWADASDDAEAIAADPLLARLMRPNAAMTWATLLQATIVQLDLTGESFWFQFADGVDSGPATDVPGMIWPFSGKAVEPYNDGNGVRVGWKVRAGNKQFEFPDSAVVHFRYFDPMSPERGLGPIEALARVLGLQFNAERYMDGLLRNSGQPGGILYAKHALTAEQVQQAQEGADASFTNENAGRVKVIGGAETTYEALGYNPKDMEHGETHSHVRRSVCAVLGVPEILIGFYDASATYHNLSEAKRSLWTETLIPLLDYIAETITSAMLEPRGLRYVAGFDLQGIEVLKQDNTDALLKVAQIVATGIGLSFNEVAAMVGLDVEPPESGDVRYTSPSLNGQEPGVEQTPAILNGAQLAQAVEIVSNVASGVIPRDSGLGMLGTLFGLTPEQANQIMGTAGTGSPTDPNVPQGLPEPAPQNGAARAQDNAPPPKFAKNADVTAPPQRDRRAYWKAFSARVLFPSQKQIELASRRFLSKYASAQRARLRDFAERGVEAKGFAKDIAINLDALLLDKREWADKFDAIIRPALEKAWGLALADAADDVGDFQLDASDPRIRQAIDRQLIKLTEGVNGTLAEKVRDAISSTLADASNIGDLQQAIREQLPELTDALSGVFGTNEARALAIARTESAHAANTARVEQYREAGIDQIEWIHAGAVTEDSRPDHVELDGQRVTIGQPFSNGLAFPHDPNATADQVVNCACISAAVIE